MTLLKRQSDLEFNRINCLCELAFGNCRKSVTSQSLERLRSAISSFCSGVIPVKAEDLAIFYRKDETPK